MSPANASTASAPRGGRCWPWPPRWCSHQRFAQGRPPGARGLQRLRRPMVGCMWRPRCTTRWRFAQGVFQKLDTAASTVIAAHRPSRVRSTAPGAGVCGVVWGWRGGHRPGNLARARRAGDVAGDLRAHGLVALVAVARCGRLGPAVFLAGHRRRPLHARHVFYATDHKVRHGHGIWTPVRAGRSAATSSPCCCTWPDATLPMKDTFASAPRHTVPCPSPPCSRACRRYPARCCWSRLNLVLAGSAGRCGRAPARSAHPIHVRDAGLKFDFAGRQGVPRQRATARHRAHPERQCARLLRSRSGWTPRTLFFNRRLSMEGDTELAWWSERSRALELPGFSSRMDAVGSVRALQRLRPRRARVRHAGR